MAKHGKMTVDEVEATLNKLGGAEGARKFRSGELKLVPRDPAVDLLLPLGESIDFSAVSRFVARDAFTKANDIAWMGDNFKQFILPLVEENIAATTLVVSELTRDAKGFRIASDLKVDERGEVALAHFFELLRRGDYKFIGAFVIGNDGEGWAVRASLGCDGWGVYACSLGDRDGWLAGDRFLSR